MNNTPNTPVFAIRSPEGKTVVAKAPPKFIPARVVTFMNFGGNAKEQKEHQPDMILLANNQFFIKAGKASPKRNAGWTPIRLSDEDSSTYLALKAKHDQQEQDNLRERKAFLATCSTRARIVTVDDCNNKPAAK